MNEAKYSGVLIVKKGSGVYTTPMTGSQKLPWETKPAYEYVLSLIPNKLSFQDLVLYRDHILGTYSNFASIEKLRAKAVQRAKIMANNRIFKAVNQIAESLDLKIWLLGGWVENSLKYIDIAQCSDPVHSDSFMCGLVHNMISDMDFYITMKDNSEKWLSKNEEDKKKCLEEVEKKFKEFLNKLNSTDKLEIAHISRTSLAITFYVKKLKMCDNIPENKHMTKSFHNTLLPIQFILRVSDTYKDIVKKFDGSCSRGAYNDDEGLKINDESLLSIRHSLNIMTPQNCSAYPSIRIQKWLNKKNQSVLIRGEGIPGFYELVEKAFNTTILRSEKTKLTSFMRRFINSGLMKGVLNVSTRYYYAKSAYDGELIASPTKGYINKILTNDKNFIKTTKHMVFGFTKDIEQLIKGVQPDIDLKYLYDEKLIDYSKSFKKFKKSEYYGHVSTCVKEFVESKANYENDPYLLKDIYIGKGPNQFLLATLGSFIPINGKLADLNAIKYYVKDRSPEWEKATYEAIKKTDFKPHSEILFSAIQYGKVKMRFVEFDEALKLYRLLYPTRGLYLDKTRT